MNTRAGMIKIGWREIPLGMASAYRYFEHGFGDCYVWKTQEGWFAGRILNNAVTSGASRSEAVRALHEVLRA